MVVHDTVGFIKHDHRRCIAEAMRIAESHCLERGLRFTAVRRRVLELLLESHVALGAYDILARLSSEGLGSKPPVVYRALGFLMEHGFVHRIERLNAFIACAHPGESHEPAFLICTDCGSIAEAGVTSPAASDGVLCRSAADSGFRICHPVREAEGTCARCDAERR